MPMFGELFVKNHEGTQLEGPRGENKCSMVCEFNHKVYRPYDMETNKLEGTRRLTAFTVIKEIDKLTPQLYEIACKGRNCKEVLIRLYRTAQDTGDEEEYQGQFGPDIVHSIRRFSSPEAEPPALRQVDVWKRAQAGRRRKADSR